MPAQDVTPLTEADLVADQPQTAPAYGSVDLPPPVAPQPPVYASAASPPGAALPPNPYKTPPPKKRKKSKRQASRDTSVSLGLWASGFVLIVFLPAAGFCAVMAMYRYSQHGWIGLPTAVAPQHSSAEHPGSVEPPSPAQQLPDATGLPQSPSNGEPLPGGKPITIWDGKQIANGGQLEFSLEYRLDGLSASSESKYFWIVLDRDQAKLEFPIPASVLKPRDHLSGQPKGASAAQFRAPYQMYLERQAPGMSQRETISNLIRVTGG